jgi:hypothetical protein
MRVAAIETVQGPSSWIHCVVLLWLERTYVCAIVA